MRLTIGKTTLKSRHFKKAAQILLFSLIVLVMIVGQAAPAFTGSY